MPSSQQPQLIGDHLNRALNNWFTYHAPQEGQPEIYQHLRNLAHSLAYEIIKYCPGGIERDNALSRLREAIMWANAGIACGDPDA